MPIKTKFCPLNVKCTKSGIVGNLESMLEPAVLAERLDADFERCFLDGIALSNVTI